MTVHIYTTELKKVRYYNSCHILSNTLLTYVLHLALSDSNGLLYVTKSYNSHSVSSLGQGLEPLFNKLLYINQFWLYE